ncbi:hypothetical protein [Parasphingopyxis marina]|uniref:Uncharacterized protein n=1 Tax=Parasphingopyxis marina TaxID=2761622 RepID=A0A842HXW8_9SPHN|nr:hypothetical protein [Parasphingopyxis marina]MBC2776344.1 hypothetical protein [Parasphingopyxis marina]
MMIVWWQGKGYLTFVILLSTATVFGIILQAVPLIEDTPYYWAIALASAAAINWYVGCRYNARKRASPKYALRKLLVYPARHRTMSIPMEGWSPILAAVATIIFLYDIAT